MPANGELITFFPPEKEGGEESSSVACEELLVKGQTVGCEGVRSPRNHPADQPDDTLEPGRYRVEDEVCKGEGLRKYIRGKSLKDVNQVNSLEDDHQKSEEKFSVTKASFESAPDRKHHEDFFRECVEVMLRDAVFAGTDRTKKVLEWCQPEELLTKVDFDLQSEPSTHEKLLTLMMQVIQYSVKTGHPYFVNQLFSTLEPYGMIAQWLTDSLNSSVYTYEVSPVFTIMEDVVLREMRTIVGYKDGKGDGVFCPGGSLSNGVAISCARYKFNPDTKTKGISGLPRLVAFTSEDAHYSIKKMAAFMGLGADNVRLIKTDARGKMMPCDLETQIEEALSQGATPFMVSATAGTTVLGAFDPIDQLADICEKYNLWLHVDAAWGGGALMSPKHKHLLRGIHRADSITWNPHKLLAIPQQCSVLLTRHENVLSEAHCANAAYLFQQDKFYDTSYDIGDKYIQCGRRADVLKFWFVWKAKGTEGFQKHVDKVFANAESFRTIIKSRKSFRMVMDEPECTNVCFWYLPPNLRDACDCDEFREKLHEVAPKIKERMMREGTMMCSYQKQKDWPNFFRIVFQSSAQTEEDMKYFADEIERLGDEIYRESCTLGE